MKGSAENRQTITQLKVVSRKVCLRFSVRLGDQSTTIQGLVFQAENLSLASGCFSEEDLCGFVRRPCGYNAVPLSC
jgi:hypothetical protein